MNYIAKIDEVGLLVPPFKDEPVAVDESRRLWLGRDVMDRFVVLLTLFSGSFIPLAVFSACR